MEMDVDAVICEVIIAKLKWERELKESVEGLDRYSQIKCAFLSPPSFSLPLQIQETKHRYLIRITGKKIKKYSTIIPRNRGNGKKHR